MVLCQSWICARVTGPDWGRLELIHLSEGTDGGTSAASLSCTIFLGLRHQHLANSCIFPKFFSSTVLCYTLAAPIPSVATHGWENFSLGGLR